VSVSEPIPVTAIILTFNEATNIERCLLALDRFADIVVVDSGSTDGTCERAVRVRPRVRIFSHPFIDFGDQRNWAMENTAPRYPWILFVDADEFMEEPLASEIGQFARDPGTFVGAFIAGRNYFLGRWLRRTTLFPSYQLRLALKGHVTYRAEGHGQREETPGPLHYLEASWRHEPLSKGIPQWIDRHNRYSTDEVALIVRLRQEPLRGGELLSRDPIVRRRTAKRLAARMPLRPLARFLYTYVLRLGFLDGMPGLYYCLLRLSHDIHIAVKVAYRERAEGPVPAASATPTSPMPRPPG